jgi:uncharacterized protein with HEPN domain
MRRDLQRLQDILEALDSVINMMGGCPESEFLGNETLRYAVAHRLTVVGEAASRLGADLKEKHPSVPWPDIVRLRNILVHEYFGIHWPLVFQTVTDDVPDLRSAIAAIVETEPAE